MSDVNTKGETPVTATPPAARRPSPAWLIPAAVTAGSLVVILLLVVAQ